MRIGLSLSGGGVRALVFHLGLLKRLSESNQWNSLAHISTVSGGSLCIGLIVAKNGGGWPQAEAFREQVLPACRQQLTEHSLVRSSLISGVLRPALLIGGRAHLMGSVLAKDWGLTQSLRDLPTEPRWTINSTTYETGKNWRFSHKRMGDYLTGYVLNPDFPVADAVAASAGFPGGIGPVKLRTESFDWVKFQEGSRTVTVPTKPLYRHYHLWDGGVYENLGSEALLKPGRGLRDDLDFYIASDAGKPLSFQKSRVFHRPAVRLLNCAMDQVRAVRARAIHEVILGRDPRNGLYVQMGLTRQQIFRLAKTTPSLRATAVLADEEVNRVAAFSTTLRRLTQNEFDLIFQHGYEAADASIQAYAPDLLQ